MTTLPSAFSLLSVPFAPPPDQAAFLLDFDGTLVDIAPTPDSVRVEKELVESLKRLKVCCGGALAIVTGRTIAEIDHFLPGIPTAIAGEHGLTLRREAGKIEESVICKPVPTEWLSKAESLVERSPGTVLERKKSGLVLHYRGNPSVKSTLKNAILSWLSGQSEFEIHPSKMAWEIRLGGVHKGLAVQALMSQLPFAGRKPVFVGDDVTDMDGVRAVRDMGGYGYLIPDDFPTAHVFRDWLSRYGGAA